MRRFGHKTPACHRDYSEIFDPIEGEPFIAHQLTAMKANYDSSNIEAENDRILRYDKRWPTSAVRYIDYGLGVFDKAVLESLPSINTAISQV